MLTPDRTPLGFFPTPLVELNNLSECLGGPHIYMKRDDLTGLALGGNKTRKLEFILADAVLSGADTLITAGAAQSNHCRQTAAAAAKLNLDCYLMLGGNKPQQANGNLLLDQLFDSHIHWTGSYRKGEAIPHLVEELKQRGKRPYIVPYGGSNELGAYGFVNATHELQAQLMAMNLAVTHIVFASSSGGTHAGLISGKNLLQAHYEIIGINIDKGEVGEVPLSDTILKLARLTTKRFQLEIEVSESDVILNSDYVGQGYGIVGKTEQEAISLTAKKEGILLDPVYTGRAMAGLIDMIRRGQFKQSDKLLFWHTGGAPALFEYANELGLSQ